MAVEKWPWDLALRRGSSNFVGHHFDMEILLKVSSGLRASKRIPCRSGVRAE